MLLFDHITMLRRHLHYKIYRGWDDLGGLVKSVYVKRFCVAITRENEADYSSPFQGVARHT